MTKTAHPKANILVAGAGGFIGGHLVAYMRKQGIKNIRAVDIKPFGDWYQKFEDVENLSLNLGELPACHQAVKGMEWVYNLAADMGGMGFIELHKAECMLTVLINTHLLMASRDAKVKRFFYASSACVYAADKQTTTENPGLKEADAYPAMPEDGYGWEKLFSERMCRHFREDYKLETRVVRYHNVYGPNGTYDGGREKAPAAICRKVIEAQKNKSGTDVAERVFHSGEVHFGPGEVEFGSENLKVGVAGGLQHIEGTGLAEENGVEAFAGRVLEAETAGGVGLGIKIDEEDPATCFGRPRGEVNGGGGLADPALLINDSHDAHTQGKRRSGELSSGFPEWFT